MDGAKRASMSFYLQYLKLQLGHHQSCLHQVISLASHPAVYNTFNAQQHLIRRPILRLRGARAFEVWEAATAAG